MAHPESPLLPSHPSDLCPVLEKVLESSSFIPLHPPTPMGRGSGIYNVPPPAPPVPQIPDEARTYLYLSQRLNRAGGGGWEDLFCTSSYPHQGVLMHSATNWGPLSCASAPADFRLHAPTLIHLPPLNLLSPGFPAQWRPPDSITQTSPIHPPRSPLLDTCSLF